MRLPSHYLKSFVSSFLILAGPAAAQNILNNGGFEYGLLCYQDYVWSNTGNFGAGDYKLLLSSDAHSGNYSLEVSCSGTDCAKGAAFSNKIPTGPNQNYTMNLWAKCPVGATTAVYIPGMANGDIFQLMNCTGDWAPNTVLFQTPTTGTDFFYYLFSYGTSWARFDDVVLTHGDGTAGPSTVLHPGIRNVSMSNNAVLVDGSPYLALGFFDVDYSDLPQLAAMGANTVFGLGQHPSLACFNTTQEKYLDRAYESGLNFVPDSSTTSRLAVPAVYPGVMQTFAPHLANIAWMMNDEPDQALVPFWYMNPPDFVANYNSAKTQTRLPLFADFQHASYAPASDDAPYVPGVDLFMAEPYGADFSGLQHATGLFQSLSPTKPIWLAQDNPAGVIVPKAYWAVINGATGIAYFTWDIFQADPPSMAAAGQVFSELNQLKNAIFAQNIDSLINTTGGIGYTGRYTGGTAYILSANPAATSPSATFQMAGLLAGQQVQVLFENRTITAGAGSFTDTFPGVSRHVYTVHYPLAGIGGTLLSFTGPDNARDWTVQLANAGLGPLTGAEISGITFKQTGGKACTPSVAPGMLPLVAGDIAPGGSVTADVIIDFTGCDTTSKFTVNVGLSADGGSVANTVLRNNQRK